MTLPMKLKKNTSYSCVMCKKPTFTLHEIFSGSANRKISIKYNLQIPLCNKCHTAAHKAKHIYQLIFCLELNINKEITKRMINNFKENKEYFEGIKDKCLKKIKSWEI